MATGQNGERTQARRPTSSLIQLLRRFRRDESGNYLIITAMLMPVLIGVTAYGTDEGILYYKKKQAQHAADSGAVTAAIAVTTGANDIGAAQAKSVAGSYGFINGQNATSVTINSPPTQGPNTNNRSAIEVVVRQAEPRIFGAIWGSAPIPIAARAVALPTGQPCILALNQTVSGAYSEQGSVNVNLINCSVVDDSSNSTGLNVGGASRLSTSFVGVVGGISGQSAITATNGVITGYHYVSDPYSGVSFGTFSGCDQRNYSTHANVTLSPGVYCGGINLGSHASVTLSPGVYYLDQGELTMTGQTSLTGTGVTLVFTSSTGSNYADAKIAGGATINLTAPTTGATAGIAIFGDRRMPTSTSFSFRGGDTQVVTGVVYLPSGAVSWAGNSAANQGCTKIIADTITLVGDSSLRVNCQGAGTKTIASPALLLE